MSKSDWEIELDKLEEECQQAIKEIRNHYDNLKARTDDYSTRIELINQCSNEVSETAECFRDKKQVVIDRAMEENERTYQASVKRTDRIFKIIIASLVVIWFGAIGLSCWSRSNSLDYCAESCAPAQCVNYESLSNDDYLMFCYDGKKVETRYVKGQ